MAVVRISARGAYIHPGPVVRIGRTRERAVCGTHGYDRLVFGGPAIGPAVIAGSEYHDSAGHRADLLAVLVHTCVRNEVVYGCLHRSDSARRGIRSRLILVAPTVLGDDGTVVGCPYHCRGGIAALILFVSGSYWNIWQESSFTPPLPSRPPATPQTPFPLPLIAPTVPATWVPWSWATME